MYETIVFAEPSGTQRGEAKATIEFVSTHIARKRINDYCGNSRIGKTTSHRETHHSLAVASAKTVWFSYPDIDCTQVWLYLTPIMRAFQVGVDDLHRPNGLPAQFGN